MAQQSLFKNKTIRASEIAQYDYCAMSWWLQRLGHKPSSPLLEKGKQVHVELGRTLDTIEKEKNWSVWCGITGGILLVVSLLILGGVIGW